MARYLDIWNCLRIRIVMSVSKGLLGLKTIQLLRFRNNTWLISIRYIKMAYIKIVGACGKNILLPVSHMITSTEQFPRIFCWLFAKGKYSRGVKQETHHNSWTWNIVYEVFFYFTLVHHLSFPCFVIFSLWMNWLLSKS